MDFKWGRLCPKGTRIILGWNDDLVDVMIMAQTDQVMHLQVNIRADNKAFLCSIIYVDNYYVSQRALWHNLVGMLLIMLIAWFYLVILMQLVIIDHSCGEFKECVQRMQVMDVNATGRHFTWNKKPKGSNCILKKIDRIMSNYHFLVDFPGSFAIVQPYRISDHSPCVIRIPKDVKVDLARNRSYGEGVLLMSLPLKHAVPGAFFSHYEQFLGDVSDKEIKEALFSMGDDKAPGPDGFTSASFKKSWDIVGGEITNAIRDFFSNGKLLKELNHTIISLIPKVSTPAKINDYRPISCCNVLFKCISKIIANRIKEDLSDLVSINQSDFVPGRQISDNILLTQELMRNYHRKRGPPRCAFKVDIQKAYDTVDWGFLRSILVGFGFHHNIVEWIMVCVSTTSYSVCINGDMYGWFNGKHGLRQGDPLSPYLFTLVMEVLTLILQCRVQNAKDFQYRHLCEQHRIVNLCFADDLFLFARGHPNSVRVIIDALEEFKNVLGLVPSIPKSNAFFCNVAKCVNASNLRQYRLLKGSNLLKYLGVPIISSRILYRDCKVLVEKLESRCQGEMKKGKDKVAWEAVCLPHREGGLGIRRLDDFNVALVAYHTRIWPFIWHNINNGRSTSMWFDRWVDSCPLCDMLTVRNIVRSGFSLSNTVSDLVCNGSWRWPHDWLSRFSNIVNILVLNIKDELDDIIFWRNVQGVFQRFSVARAWDSLRLRADVVDWYHVVRAFTGMSFVPPRLMDVLAFLIPSKGSPVSKVISRVVLATMTYCLWNERNSRLFKKKKLSADQIVQLITSLVQMKLVTFEFKKMSTGSRLMLVQWKIPSSCYDHDKSSR
ncbi:uncharacterized protein Tco_0677399 [Tanacetum coccineum]|uniref:Reverse transcriptase domain-containing protein n=1 Tax=Tanacetum coccineum TaxID=301880 RepID=A0ABQ4XC29_9ASTR